MPDATGKFKGISVPSIPWHDEAPTREFPGCPSPEKVRQGERCGVRCWKDANDCAYIFSRWPPRNARMGLATNQPRPEK